MNYELSSHFRRENSTINFNGAHSGAIYDDYAAVEADVDREIVIGAPWNPVQPGLNEVAIIVGLKNPLSGSNYIIVHGASLQCIRVIHKAYISWLSYSSIGEENGTGTVAGPRTYNHNPAA